MAIGRMEAKVVSRGSGHSAVAKSAYNARETLTAERYDKIEDYSRKAEDCLFRGFYAPKDAPEWAQERGRFWNAVEWREKRKDAQLGREFEIALPAELTAEQNRWLLQDFVRENFTRRGYVADVAIHAPSKDGDERNIHAHVFAPLRRIEGDHWAEKKDRPSELERKAELKALRESWEKLTNRHLSRHGFNERIDMRSYAEQGVDRAPGVHMGKEATGKERRGEATELGNRNRAAANENQRRAANDELTAEQIMEARERAGYVRQQRAGAKAKAEEREQTMWDQSDGSTLSNMRQRDREAGPSRSTENEARRAMDDLARTDPHGTARHFGHHAGDRLKSPEEMRREMAERLRGFATNPQPEPARDRASPDLGREQAARPTAEPQQRDQVDARRAPLDARAAWAATLRGFAEEGPQKPARGLEPVRGPTTPAERPRPSTGARERPAASFLQAAISSARQRLHTLGARLETVRAAIMTRGSGRAYDGHTGGGAAREDTSSRKVNADAAAEQKAVEREAKAREVAASRDTARVHDRQQHTHAKTEEKRVRRSIWEEDMRRAELEAAADQLRRALERPGEHEHSRERKL